MEIQDKMISKAIISNYMQDLLHYLETDVLSSAADRLV